MAVLKKIFSSLKKFFGRRVPVGRNKKQQRKTKLKVRKRPAVRARRKSSQKTSRPRLSPKKVLKKKVAVPAKRSRHVSTSAVVSSSQRKASSDKTPPTGRPVGEITHYFSKIRVVVVKMTKGNLAVGDKVRIHGKTTDFTQVVRSMQVESVDVRSARSGQLIGLKVVHEAKVGDKLYKPV